MLGASIAQLWGLLSREFILLVSLSSVIAIPVSLYFMTGWLKNYSYHVMLTWEVFGAAVTGAVIITMATVSYQVLKAAFTNPVKSLRTE